MLPDLQLVCDQARGEFANMLAAVEGSKDIVIQEELMALLDHVTPFSFLKKLNVDRIYKLEPNMSGGATKRFYVTRPDVLSVSQIAFHVQSDNRAKEAREYFVIFVPRRLATSEFILEREGVYGFVKILEWNLHLIPLDAHLLSLERFDAIRSLYIHGDTTMLHSVAQSLLQLEAIYGLFPLVHGKGHLAELVWALFKRIKEAKQLPLTQKPGGPKITEVIILDRKCDLITPLCSQLTYEGILDDVFSIQSGYVSVSKEVTGKKDVKVPVNTKDLVFNEIRGLNFPRVPEVLSAISQGLKHSYQEGKGYDSIPELKKFVKKLPELTKKHDSLATHLKVSERIVQLKIDKEFSRHLFIERAILEATEKSIFTEFIEECIQRQIDFHIPLRLLCLMSVTNNGIKSKYLDPLKKQYLHSYGHKHLTTFHHLEKLGLIGHKVEESGTPGKAQTRSTFKQLSKLLKLVPKDPDNISTPTDMSYVYGGGYKPLSCAAVDHVTRNAGWRGLDDVVRGWSGPIFTHTQSSGLPFGSTADANKVILVYFIGGCTFSEVNALRLLGRLTRCQYIIATTNTINCESFINAMLGEE